MRIRTEIKTENLAAFIRAAHRLNEELGELEFTPAGNNNDTTVVSYIPLYSDTNIILMIMYLDALREIN